MTRQARIIQFRTRTPNPKPQVPTAPVKAFDGVRPDYRNYYAERTNARSPGFEVTTPAPSIGALVWQLAPFIGLGLVLLALFGRRV